MRRSFASLLILSLVSWLAPPTALAASTGTIAGRVTDDAGAEVPGAKVTAASSLTTRSTYTSADGAFRFERLPAGEYTVTAALAGFAPSSRVVRLRGGRTERLQLQLRVASMTETITVMAESAAITVRSSGTAELLPRELRRGADWNTEKYKRIEDNPFVSPGRHPLSTFSVDVDTASYANVRRFLRDDELPPPDAVRIEELLNYFTYDYPAPEDGPLALHTELSTCPWNEQHRLALVALRGRPLPVRATPPRNLVFLVDVSGSMDEPDKLPLLKDALRRLVAQLDGRDRLALVVYAGSAGLVLPSTAGDRRADILAALDRLEAGGSTNGGEGIELAYRVARQHFAPDGVNRVVLATDGDFNVGVTSEGDLTRLIEKQRRSGVFLSVLGFGRGNLGDATMEALADRGNGNYAYIDTLREAEKVLVREAGSTLVTVARDVKIQVEFNPRHVSAYRLIGYENRMLEDEDFRDDTKDAGEIGAGGSVTALYEIVPAGIAARVGQVDPLKYQEAPAPSAGARAAELMTVKVRFKRPQGGRSAAIEAVVLDAVTDAAGASNAAFASAVAEFGLLLRDSPHKGTATYEQALERARSVRGADAHGDRAEFEALVARAAELAQRRRSAGVP